MSKHLKKPLKPLLQPNKPLGCSLICLVCSKQWYACWIMASTSLLHNPVMLMLVDTNLSACFLLFYCSEYLSWTYTIALFVYLLSTVCKVTNWMFFLKCLTMNEQHAKICLNFVPNAQSIKKKQLRVNLCVILLPLCTIPLLYFPFVTSTLLVEFSSPPVSESNSPPTTTIDVTCPNI